MAALISSPVRADRMLFDFEGKFDLSRVETRDVRIEIVRADGGQALLIASAHNEPWPGITLKPEDGKWDLTAFRDLAVDIRNTGDEPVSVGLRLDNPGADGWRNCNQEIYHFKAGERRTVRLDFRRRLPEGLKLFGMRGYPGGFSGGENAIDLGNCIGLLVFVPRPDRDHEFVIDNVRATGTQEALPVPVEKFFPFMDEFGQYAHKDWPGKTHSEKELKRRLDEETTDLDRHPGPEKWNRYGGWLGGPDLKATGYFYPKKHEGKWWLVDPEGRLFFSHGLDCVGGWADSPVTEREHWFKDFPGEKEEFRQFWGETSHVVFDYYKGKKVRYFNWAGANLMRKYGDDWARKFGERCHERLRSWGMNTIGNWSSHEICTMKKTPYVVAIHTGGKAIEGSEGYWGQFRDVFDPSFDESLRGSFEWHRTRTANDPWLIGYFVDNELSWGNETELAVAALASPKDQAAKREFVDDLRKKYSSIGKLNRAWGTDHQSWDELLESKTPPDKEKARDDLLAFSARIADTYFRKCREAVKRVAPNNLYMGPRFAWVNDLAFQAAAKYCDVVSYNLYSRDVSGFRLPGNADRPVIIGEWHAGALDRGMFHTGLQSVESQAERAEFYINYATSALRNPLFVGCHWFTLMDEATTGRSLDGENYQIGFVDICDTPYPETIAASREVGYKLYETRSAK